MTLKLGTTDATLRLGDAAYPTKAYLGDTLVAATVPGAPTIISVASQGPGGGEVQLTAPANGGSPITGYNVYVVGTTDPVNEGVVPVDGFIVSLDFDFGAEVQIAAVNAIGEGPKSDPELVT